MQAWGDCARRTIWASGSSGSLLGVSPLRLLLVRLHLHFYISGITRLMNSTAAIFLVDPVKEFNNRIDHPAEKEEELFGNSGATSASAN